MSFKIRMVKKMKINRISQAFYSDFIIAVLIFSVTLIIYLVYIINLPEQGKGLQDELLADSKTISSSLTSAGYPTGWKSNNVARIGFTDSYNRIDNNNFNEFMEINYNTTRKLFGTTYDYILFFVNESGDVQNIEGFCGAGKADAKISYDIKSAYYYNDETFLRQFMTNIFNADVYSPSGQDITDLIANIGNYEFIVMESPEFTTNVFNNIKGAIEDWVIGGGLFMLSGRISSSNGAAMLGAKFYKVGEAGLDEPATVIRNDEFMAFDYADQIVFSQVRYVEDVSVGSNFIDIARFNESDVEIEDIMDNDIAIARWFYGSGKALFFSDFDATYAAGDFEQALEASIKKWVGGKCAPINISSVKRDDLVKTERLLIYDNNIVKMVLYVFK